MDNLTIYNAVRVVPPTALKEIQAGRLKGKSDINPMWRIKALTEQFGPCGIGWRYAITKKWLEPGANNEVVAFVDIDLFVVDPQTGTWSEAIPGTGGSSFIANERNGLYTSDECYKMALTDAISVSCKALGVGADVYWEKDRTKYSPAANTPANAPQSKPQAAPAAPSAPANAPVASVFISEAQVKRLYALAKGDNARAKNILGKYGYTSSKEIKRNDYEAICKEMENADV